MRRIYSLAFVAILALALAAPAAARSTDRAAVAAYGRYIHDQNFTGGSSEVGRCRRGSMGQLICEVRLSGSLATPGLSTAPSECSLPLYAWHRLDGSRVVDVAGPMECTT